MSNATNNKLKYEAIAFLITAKTNMHPGAGSESYGVIDNLVQRDAATRFPTIHSTSLKGALREFFEDGLSNPVPGLVDYVFGTDLKRDKTKDPAAGNYRFFAADLVSIPVRSDEKIFVNLTCPGIAKRMLDMINTLEVGVSTAKKGALEAVANFQFPNNAKACHFDSSLRTIILEENDTKAVNGTIASVSDAQKIFGDNLVVVHDDVFGDLTDDLHLPVVARNQLNNGISENLWYEQILPRETRFWFPVLYPKGNGVTNFYAQFQSTLVANPVQIGANASVGYGFCEIANFPA